jgi:hypothetical protein
VGVRLSFPNWLPTSLTFHAFEVPGNRIDHSPGAPKESFSPGPTKPLGGGPGYRMYFLRSWNRIMLTNIFKNTKKKGEPNMTRTKYGFVVIF